MQHLFTRQFVRKVSRSSGSIEADEITATHVMRLRLDFLTQRPGDTFRKHIRGSTSWRIADSGSVEGVCQADGPQVGGTVEEAALSHDIAGERRPPGRRHARLDYHPAMRTITDSEDFNSFFCNNTLAPP